MTATAGSAGLFYDVHAELRDATERTHLDLHDLPRFRAIAEGRLDRADYADLLRALHGFHSAISGAAQRGGLAHLSSSAARLDRIEADLETLGEPAPGRSDPLKACSPAALYGALYVAEGSALGGRVIARQLDYMFAESPEGRSFFAGDGALGATWRAFLAALSSAWPERRDLAQLVVGAQAAFGLFAEQMAR